MVVLVGAVAVAVESWRDRAHHRRWAETRPALDKDGFVRLAAAQGVACDLAEFLWAEFSPYCHRPLTPYPSDRIYRDLRIDPWDIRDIALRFEERSGREVGDDTMSMPDPTLAEFGRALAGAKLPEEALCR